MTIKTTLQQLFGLFVRSANNEQLDLPIRQLAARLTVLTAHSSRIEGKIDAIEKRVDHQIAELTSLMSTLAARLPASATPAQGAQAPTGGETPPMSEDAEAEAMAAKVIADTEAEVAAAAKKGTEKPAAVTPIRKTTLPTAPVTPASEDVS